MVDPAVLPGFVLAAALISIAPGPDNTFIAAIAVSRGRRAGITAAGGMAIAMCVHVTFVSIGLAYALRASPWALEAIELAGSGYLAWLSISTFRELRHAEPAAQVPEAPVLRQAILTNLTNPKVIIFFVSFLPQFTSPHRGAISLQLAVLGAIFLLVGLASDTTVALIAGTLGDRTASARRTRALTIAAGSTFAALAVLLLIDALN